MRAVGVSYLLHIMYHLHMRWVIDLITFTFRCCPLCARWHFTLHSKTWQWYDALLQPRQVTHASSQTSTCLTAELD